MRELKERAAYLRGLIQGSDFAQDEKQRMVWDGLMDFCDEVADDLSELKESEDEFADYVEAIDEDLSTLEKFLYHDEDGDEDGDTITSRDGAEDYTELTCPHCQEAIYFTEEPGDGNYQVVCPDCGKVVWNHLVVDEKTATHNDVI